MSDDLTNLQEWNSFCEKRMTVLEVLTLLNNRHRERMAEVIAERDDAHEQLSSICEELFGNDDTIGGESAADYVIRQVTKERETLRDRFAMAALTGIAQAGTTAYLTGAGYTPTDAVSADWAYGYADAMLAAREGGAA